MKANDEWIPTETDLAWIEATSPRVHPVLEEIERAAEPDHVPILDRASGRVLAALAAGRREILEIGTAFGYSTLWMALAQPPDGRIVTIDPDRSRTERARTFWAEAGIAEGRIEVVTARALDALRDDDPRLRGPFDLVFIDALKHEYGDYLEAVLPRLAPGALVVADNVLWSGRVSGARAASDERPDDLTEALRRFNAAALHDPRLAATILPVGDGLLTATVRSGQGR
jgi:caffeoyl-CoA O-methyltransferase